MQLKAVPGFGMDKLKRVTHVLVKASLSLDLWCVLSGHPKLPDLISGEFLNPYLPADLNNSHFLL